MFYRQKERERETEKERQEPFEDNIDISCPFSGYFTIHFMSSDISLYNQVLLSTSVNLTLI